ncbi:hypothetical protein Taro_037828 [Colocasia esculenta]|uniref:Uncharacterized protein n=1 Tax=Colocasia esculenta TaxID=4460 RepID=A0A843WQW5_COLES|nr:hypothetical protein [Colocasia esculenta]
MCLAHTKPENQSNNHITMQRPIAIGSLNATGSSVAFRMRRLDAARSEAERDGSGYHVLNATPRSVAFTD